MATKEPNLEELKPEIEKWATKIEELNARAADVDPEKKAMYLDTMEELNQTLKSFRFLIKDVERRQKSRWEKLADDLEKMLSDLDDGYRKVLEHFF